MEANLCLGKRARGTTTELSHFPRSFYFEIHRLLRRKRLWPVFFGARGLELTCSSAFFSDSLQFAFIYLLDSAATGKLIDSAAGCIAVLRGCCPRHGLQ